MKKRMIALLLVLALFCSLVPTVLAAPSPASTVSATATLAYELKGLKHNSVVQNFYVDSDYLYITQSAGSGTFYLSRLKISGTTATYVDHMTFTNCGNGESLAGYHYNGKLYFFIGAKGLEATSYGSTQIARVQYEAGKSYAYTSLNRFIHLSSSTADGTSVGSANRVAVAANELFTVFRIQTTDNSVTYSCYYTKALNQALDAGTSVGMETAGVTAGFLYTFTQTKDNRVLPNNSFQGLELANSDSILVCGGNSGETPAIAKMSSGGTYQILCNITNIGTNSTGPIAMGGDRVYIAYVPASSGYLNEQKIYSVPNSKLGLPTVSYESATLGYTLTGLKFNTAIQNFYIDSDYIYITQGNETGTVYLSRLKISGTTAAYVDHMTLTDTGNGETLAGYHYNGKLYFYVGSKGLEATSYRSTQIARIQYEAGKTYVYTDLKRFSHLANSTANGATLGSAVRVACGADDNYTVMRVELDDGTTCYTCYDTKVLNKALDQATITAMESDAVRSGFVYHFKQKKALRVIPNNSFQGVELAGLNAILTSGGNSKETPAVGKMNKNGTYERLAYITNIGTAATGPVEYINDRLYIVATNSNKIYYIGGDKLGIAQTAVTTYTAEAAAVKEAASYIKANMDAGILPATVSVGGKSCTNAQFLEMACKLLLSIADGAPASTVSYTDVAAPSSPSGSPTGTVMQADYVAMARSICAEIESFRRAPGYTSSRDLGKMQHSYCVYMYAFILDYYVRYGMLPEAYAVVAWKGTTGAVLSPEVPGVSHFETAMETTLHQLPSVVPDAETGDYMQNLSIVVRTEDGKTVVFDGGRKSYDSDYLFKYLQRVTGDPTPHVDAWFMTHAHSDHHGAIIGISSKYASQLTIDAFYHHFPTEAQVNKYFAGAEPASLNSGIKSVLTAVGKFKNSEGGAVDIVTVNAIHTGECNSTFDFGNLHIDVLLTVEDVIWAADHISTKYTATWETHNASHTNLTPKELLHDNFNNTSTVFRLTVGGKTVMITGDAAPVSTIMLERYHKEHSSDSSKYYSLKTDYVTMAHHGSRRGLSQAVYKLIDPDVVLWPAPYAGITNDDKTLYPRQWIAALGSATYISYQGPQVFTFAAKRSATATAIPAELKDLVFQAEYYANAYPELKAAYGTDETLLYNHFVNYGLEEGRCASPYFDVRFYMNNNGEQLREHCHGDYNVAFAHFLKYVSDTNERKNNPKLLSATFDCAYYGSAYSDTKTLTTELALLQHYVTVGEAEGRLASQGFLAADGLTYHKKSTCVVTEGTCSKPGSIKYTCSDCGYTYTKTEVSKEHSYTETVTAPTCTADGYITYTCTVCGHSYTEAGAPSTGHSYDAVVTEPTCTEVGYTVYTCALCGDTYTEQGSETAGHSYNAVVTEPTCTADGYTTYTCTACGHSYTEAGTPSAGHSYDAVVTEPTCTEDGYTTYTCTACGHSYTEAGTASEGHSYSYSKIDELTHKVSCSACGVVEVTSHVFIDGTCICGAVEIKEPQLDSSLKLSHSLNLASDISINFVVPGYLLEGYDMDTVYVESTVENYEGETYLGTTTVRMEPVQNGSMYYFTLTGITAVQMNDTISSILYGERDGQPYYSNADLYSVAQYAYSQLSKPNSSDTLKTLCADLLRYGANAQLYKEYRTSNLADENMTEAYAAYLSDLEAVTFGNNNADLGDLANAPIVWAGKTLDLDSKVCLKFVFNTSTYTGDLADLSLKVSYKDVYGETMNVTVTDVVEYNPSRNLYAFSVDALLASELREVVSVQIFEGETPVSTTFQYSADTYGNNKTGTLLELCKALFVYSDSAKAYFTN